MESILKKSSKVIENNLNNEMSQYSVPQIINIPHLVNGRNLEISRFVDFIQKSTTTRRCFQKLPPYLRRRSMSYNIYRTPRRIRSTLLSEMSKAPPKISRRKRKDRRRLPWIKKNLLFRAINYQNFCEKKKRNLKIRYVTNLSAICRQRHQKYKIDFPLNQLSWLESHLFHSKRFHMCEAFGYKLALYSTCKRKRKIYRSLKNNFLIHDSSYLHLFQLTGKENQVSFLFKLCNFNTDFLFSQKYIDGNLRGSGFLFQLTPEKFMELYKNEINFESLSFFSWERIAPIEFIWIKSCGSCNSDRSIWVWVHPIASCQLFSYWDKCIETFELKIEIHFIEDINRFELMGPKSLDILQYISNKKFYSHIRTQFLNETRSDLIHEIQIKLPLSFKASKKLIRQNEVTEGSLDDLTLLTNYSEECSFYCGNYRRQLREEYYKKKQQIKKNHMHSNSVPFITFVKLETERTRKRRDVKDLLRGIRNRTNKRSNLNNKKSSNAIESDINSKFLDLKAIIIFHQGNQHGFDLFLPRGVHSTILLRYVQLLSAQVIGIGERKSLNLEMGIPSFPFDYIETLSNQKLQITNSISSKLKNYNHEYCDEVSNFRNYIKTPASKRVNYLFNKIEFPFLINWEKILNGQFSNKKSAFCTNTRILKDIVLNTNCHSKELIQVKNYKIFVARTGYRGSMKEHKDMLEVITFNPEWKYQSLVLVKIFSKSNINCKSHIYMYEKDDEFTFKKNSLVDTPFKHGKNSLKKCSKNETNIIDVNCDFEFKTIRKLVGVVTSGGYSMTRGGGFGIGYISLESFNRSREEQNKDSLNFWIRYNGLNYKSVKVEKLYFENNHFKIY